MVTITLRKKHVYFMLLGLGIFAFLVGVSAYNSDFDGTTSGPPNFGHSADEINVDVGGTLKTVQQAINDLENAAPTGTPGVSPWQGSDTIYYDGGQVEVRNNLFVVESNPDGDARMNFRTVGQRLWILGIDDDDSIAPSSGSYKDNVDFKIGTSTSHRDWIGNPPSQATQVHLTIQPDGDVGIGTEDPNRDLHILDSGDAQLRLETTSSSSVSEISFETRGTETAGQTATIGQDPNGNIYIRSDRNDGQLDQEDRIVIRDDTDLIEIIGRMTSDSIATGSIDITGTGNIVTQGVAIGQNLDASQANWFRLPRRVSPPVTCDATTSGMSYFDTNMPNGNLLPCVCLRYNGNYHWAPTDNYDAICD